MVINDAIGLVALIVFALALVRGVQRRADLALTISDAIIALGVEFETLASSLWHRQTRDIPYNERWGVKEGRLLRLVDRITNALFNTGWAIERRVLGVNYYGGFGRNFSVSAASPVDYSHYGYDYLDDEGDELYAVPDDYEYDY